MAILAGLHGLRIAPVRAAAVVRLHRQVRHADGAAQPRRDGRRGAVPAAAWALLVLLVLSGLTTIIAMSRLGIRAFWVPSEQALAQVRMIEIAPVAMLLLLYSRADGGGGAGDALHAGHGQPACAAKLCAEPPPRHGRRMRRVVPFPLLSCGLLATWLLLNQSFPPPICIVGVVLSLGASWVLALRMREARLRRPGAIVRLSLRVLGDIVRSNIAVASIISGVGRRDADVGLRHHPACGCAILTAWRCWPASSPPRPEPCGWASTASGDPGDPRPRPGRRGRLDTDHQERYERLLLEIFE